MRSIQLMIPALLLMLWPASSVDAQLIQITPNGAGGVNVRAPFVRVQSSPYGGSYVRAPFVRVNSPPPVYYHPPRYYQPPYYSAPVQPTYGTPYNSQPVPAPQGVVQPPVIQQGVVQPSSNQQGTTRQRPVNQLQMAPSMPPNTTRQPVQTTRQPIQKRVNTVPSTPKAVQGQPTPAPPLKSVLEKPKTYEELPPPKNNGGGRK